MSTAWAIEPTTTEPRANRSVGRGRPGGRGLGHLSLLTGSPHGHQPNRTPGPDRPAGSAIGRARWWGCGVTSSVVGFFFVQLSFASYCRLAPGALLLLCWRAAVAGLRRKGRCGPEAQPADDSRSRGWGGAGVPPYPAPWNPPSGREGEHSERSPGRGRGHTRPGSLNPPRRTRTQ